MKSKEKVAEVLNDLIKINSERASAYEKAADDIIRFDLDLRTIFNSMAKDSRHYITALSSEIINLGYIATEVVKSKIFHIETVSRASFNDYDRQAILESCESGEDLVQRAYNMAIAAEAEMDNEVILIILNQKAYLKTAHKLIKNYRDARWKMIA